MNDDQLLERCGRALAPAYELFYDEPVHLVRGEGVWLFDADGRRYLDCYNNVPSVGLPPAGGGGHRDAGRAAQHPHAVPAREGRRAGRAPRREASRDGA